MLLDHLGHLEQRLAAHDVGRADASLAAADTLRELLAGEFIRPLFGGLAIESGLIVDSRSRPDIDPVPVDGLLCERDAPRLERAGAPTAWPAESVVAILDVVPRIDLPVMTRAVAAAHQVKALRRSLGPADADDDALRAVRCFLVAFEGPPRMEQVHIWLRQACRDNAVVESELPDAGIQRERHASAALDGVFVLGRGFLSFDNVDLGLIDDEARQAAAGACWVIAGGPRSALAALYQQIRQARSVLAASAPDLRAYLGRLAVADLRFGN